MQLKEIVAVLAHELGHWSYNHVIKMFVISVCIYYFFICIVSHYYNGWWLFVCYKDITILITIVIMLLPYLPLYCNIIIFTIVVINSIYFIFLFRKFTYLFPSGYLDIF